MKAAIRMTPTTALNLFKLFRLLETCQILLIGNSLFSTEVSAQSSISLKGKGASFPFSVYSQWRQSYRSHRLKHRDVTISYDSVGSGAGRKAIIQKEVDFAGSDSLLSDEEKAQAPDLVQFPTLAGGIVLAYNLPTCSSRNGQRLNLSREHVVGIYNGTYTNWMEPSIRANNPNCTLPNATIIVIARRVKSGTTNIFTTALSAFDSSWAAQKGSFSEGVSDLTDEPLKWDKDVIRYFGPNNQDVSGLIRSLRYSLGYLSLGDADGPDMDYAALGNRQGHFITADSNSLQAAMNSKVDDQSLTPDLVDPKLPEAYPIASYTYLIIYKTDMSDCVKATELIRFVLWFIDDEVAQKEATTSGFATLSTEMGTRVKDEILSQIMCQGQSVMSLVKADIAAENVQDKTWLIPVAVTVPLFLLMAGGMAASIIYQRIKLDKMINTDDWNIPIEDIVFFYDEKAQAVSTGKSRFLRQKSVKSLRSLGEISEGSELLTQILQWPGKWRTNTVGIRLLEIPELKTLNREMKKTMLWMRDSLINTNVVRFYGLTELDGDRYCIGEFCSKGTVLDVLQNGKFNLNMDFKLSVASEIASGMSFLHSNGMIHGMLTSSCCMLDNKWTVKISDWEYHKLLTTQNKKKNPLIATRSRVYTGDKYDTVFRDFWTAPEILRSDYEEWPTQACDVYSYSIILQELFTRDDPYYELVDHMTPEQIIHAVVHNRLRPEASSDAPITIRQVMELSWSETPSARPTFEQITKMLRRSRTGRKTIMDNMMEAMEDYTAHLEEEIEAKESALQAVKTNLDTLMSEMVPPQMLTAINDGEKVESKIYPALGVIMMEIVDWRTVMEVDAINTVLKFLDNFTCQINQIAKKYHAFCPYSQHHYSQTYVIGIENETRSLGDRCYSVAHMALDVMRVITRNKPPHSKVRALPVRLSAHVGVVASGTIGVTSPKFLLLGDGMDVGRALLANAETNTVKISRSLYTQLEKSPEFEFSTKEPEWITCNGTDIEAFILTGRRTESIQISSDASVDSGIYVDHPQSKSSQQGNPLTSVKVEIDMSTKAPNPSKSTTRPDKPSLIIGPEERQSSSRRLKNNQQGLKTRNSNYKHRKRKDGEFSREGRKSNSEFPSTNRTSLPLSRISENSDNTGEESNDSNIDEEHVEDQNTNRLSVANSGRERVSHVDAVRDSGQKHVADNKPQASNTITQKHRQSETSLPQLHKGEPLSSGFQPASNVVSLLPKEDQGNFYDHKQSHSMSGSEISDADEDDVTYHSDDSGKAESEQGADPEFTTAEETREASLNVFEIDCKIEQLYSNATVENEVKTAVVQSQSNERNLASQSNNIKSTVPDEGIPNSDMGSNPKKPRRGNKIHPT